MATTSSPPVSRVAQRRAAVVQQALDHAIDIMGAEGVGALTVSEVARRMGMRGPSLYKYFPSLHALYDALFLRGILEEKAAIEQAIADQPRGVPRIRATARAVVRWSVENPALAQLLHWRPVPGFEPSPESFAPSVEDLERARAEFAEAVRRGQLTAEATSDDAMRLYATTFGGVISEQLANEPGVPFEKGVFSRLIDDAMDMFIARYTPPPPH
jgi:AcrR family transcriptional regulator